MLTPMSIILSHSEKRDRDSHVLWYSIAPGKFHSVTSIRRSNVAIAHTMAAPGVCWEQWLGTSTLRSNVIVLHKVAAPGK